MKKKIPYKIESKQSICNEEIAFHRRHEENKNNKNGKSE